MSRSLLKKSQPAECGDSRLIVSMLHAGQWAPLGLLRIRWGYLILIYLCLNRGNSFLPMLSARATEDPRRKRDFTLNQFNMIVAPDGDCSGYFDSFTSTRSTPRLSMPSVRSSR